MRTRPRLHAPSIVGRTRADPGPLLLTALVVAVTTALLSAANPLLTRTSDRALADAVRRTGEQSAVVGTFPRAENDHGTRTRDPRAVDHLQAAVNGAQLLLPERIAAVVQPGIASVSTSALQVLGAGPGRYVTLIHLEGPSGEPRVSYTAGGPPRATVGVDRAAIELAPDAPPWPVQVALSEAAAAALGLAPGDRISAKDEQGRPVEARVSGVFRARDTDDRAWRTSPLLLHPARSVAAGARTAAAAALVSSAALPDLQLAVPATDLTTRVRATPRATALTWSDSRQLIRAVVSLKTSPAPAGGPVWDSTLDRVVEDARTQVAAARGQADVLLLSVLVCALLVLWQAADLLVRRRAHSLVLTRERGGTLLEIAAELLVESAGWVLAGSALGLLATRLALGHAAWGWWALVPLLAAVVAAVHGAALASRSTDPRRSPANRTARRVEARLRRLRRVAYVGAVVGGAVLSLVALRQRGVLDAAGGGGDPTAASAPVWWAVAGALLVVAAFPTVADLLLGSTRRASGGVAFFAASRVRETGARALPLLVVTVTVAQLTFAVALTSTEQRGQAAGALLSVGGDARATVPSGVPATELARRVAAAPGVRSAVAARVDDGVQVSSLATADEVQLVVVDAVAYERLLARSALPDAPQLDRLAGRGDGVPVLLLGGARGLRDGLSIQVADDQSVSLSVVGTAPRVQDTVDPVLVVDARTYARAGGVTTPNTIWAVGPGAAAAVRASAGPAGEVLLYSDAVAARRDAPLASGLVRLALASSTLLLLFAVLGVAMGASAEAVARGVSLGRLRSLGLRDDQLWRVLAGELVAPVLVGGLGGLLLGAGAAWAMFGHLSLERITGQVSPPDVSVPWWALLSGVVLVAAVLVLAHVEWTRLRRVSLGALLRGGRPQ
ncbi:FtsX-like permease family protein [Nocardioides sp. URHA0020]|uniref:FtsX-like permease family protein n=1 Tax=Nocardioides sp. URHA0020 TaxID=1380392 RepID=UPI0005618B46|nr:FtsX-like permease family protein [Nocardioides sp. URHA0020]